MKGSWIFTDKPQKNKIFIFKKEFDAKGELLNFKVSANSRYRLYINGTFVCEGPCKSDRLQKVYEESSVRLNNGKNVLIAEVLYITEHFCSVFPGDEPSFYFEGEYGGEILVSDESFVVAEDKTKTFVYPEHTAGFVHSSEIYEPGNKMPDFKPAKILYTPSETGCSAVGTLDKYKLEKRKIPFMKYEEEKSFSVTKSSVGLKGEFSGIKADKDFFVEFDSGKYTTYYPKLVICANEGAKIRLIYSEVYYIDEEKTAMKKADRCDVNGYLCGCSDLIISDGTEIEFTPFWFRSGRFVRIEAENVTDVEIKEFSYRSCHYDLNIINNFKCSDKDYCKMWDISVNTLLCCLQEIIVDCPYYEQQQYLMDSSMSMLYIMSISDDKRLVEKTIEEMSAEFAPEGLIYCNYPSRHRQIIPGFCIFYIFMLKNYITYTGNIEFVRKHTGTVEKILSFFESKLMPQGYVGPTGYWPFVDWGKGWKRGVPGSDPTKPLTYYSLLYSIGLKWMAEIYRELGRENTAKDLELKRTKLNEAINKHCFKNGVYIDIPEEGGISQHCQIMAILGEVCEKSELLFERMLGEEMTECSFSMSFFLLRTFEKQGRYELADKLFDKWRIMIGNNMTTWGESLELPRSECHAWSSVMLYEFTSVILGIKPLGENRVVINPYTENLDFASGSFAVGCGKVDVRWEKKNGKLILEVSSTDNIVKIINGIEYTDNYIKTEIV